MSQSVVVCRRGQRLLRLGQQTTSPFSTPFTFLSNGNLRNLGVEVGQNSFGKRRLFSFRSIFEATKDSKLLSLSPSSPFSSSSSSSSLSNPSSSSSPQKRILKPIGATEKHILQSPHSSFQIQSFSREAETKTNSEERNFSTTTTTIKNITTKNDKEETWGERVFWRFTKKNITASPEYNRWWSVAGSFLVQTSIGTVYAWSVFNNPLCRQLGVVASAANDWSLIDVIPIFSYCAATLGVCTALLGPWAERWGPRASGTAASLSWSGGLLLSAYGVYTHTLPLVMIGYGIFGGIGWGLGYISPVSTMMRWFPDRRGLATGLALTAFGGGAILATPLTHFLYDHFSHLPDFLGSVDDVQMITTDGVRYAEVDGDLKEVVVATSSDLAHISKAAEEGVYLVGTGSVGTVETFCSLAAVHAVTMLTGSALMKVPAEEWKPSGWEPPSEEELNRQMKTSASVHHNEALKTPQFYLLWSAVFGNAVAGVTVISSAKTIISDTFHAALPGLVTGAFAGSYLMALSSANMLGRLGWATLSDVTGRKNAYYIFGLGIPLTLGIPQLTALVSSGTMNEILPLGMFIGGTFCIVSFYGGLFSVLPAYLADLFGQKHVGAIHGRLLTAWAAASVVGPNMMAYLRQHSHTSAMKDLAVECDPDLFLTKFGAPVSSLDRLIEAKTVSIPQLMSIVPEGVLDPSAHLYDTTLYSMSVLLTFALLCNAAIKPVHPRHHIPSDPPPSSPSSSFTSSFSPKSSHFSSTTTRNFSSLPPPVYLLPAPTPPLPLLPLR